MNPVKKSTFVTRVYRFFVLLVLATTLTGCIYWIRAYQTYLQLSDFDRYFAIEDEKIFAVHFKKPILLSDDFVSLSKLQPSSSTPNSTGKRWRYTFHKVNAQQKPFKPDLTFFFDLDFNQDNRISQWTFSPLFLQIAPPKFLEVSLRSLANADLNKDKRQLHANADSITKIAAILPQKAPVIAQLGEPLEIKPDGDQEIYVYNFLLDTHDIEPGYEDRALSVVNLTFDKASHELVRMGGRFAGLKVSVNYRKFLINSEENDAAAQ
jgi:hypothetical protein